MSQTLPSPCLLTQWGTTGVSGASLDLFDSPRGVVFDSDDNSLFIAEYDNRRIKCINTLTGKTRVIVVDGLPLAIALARGRDELYISLGGNGHCVLVVDKKRGNVVRTIGKKGVQGVGKGELSLPKGRMGYSIVITN